MEKYQVKLKGYHKGKLVGQGSYADVYEITNKSTGEHLAGKISLSAIEEEIDRISFEREITILAKLRHASFVKFIGYSPTDFKGKEMIPVIITELIPNGSLADIIMKSTEKQEPKWWDDTKKLISLYGVACGMAYLHENHIIHRDVKPDNVLLDSKYYPRITDFGLSKIFDANMADYQSMNGGTAQYMAPEIITNMAYNTSVDVYAFGILVYEVMTGTFAYDGMPSNTIMARVVDGYRPPIPDIVPSAYKKLIKWCWVNASEKRPTFQQIVEVMSTDEGFLYDKIDKEEFLKYRKYVDTFSKNDHSPPNSPSRSKNSPSHSSSSSSNNQRISPSSSKKGFGYIPEDQIQNLSPENIKLLEQAETNKDNDALFTIGRNLLEGINGFPQNSEGGIKYLTYATDSCHVDSLLYLGMQYYLGKYIPQDTKKAKALLFEASSLDNTDAMVQLGLIFKAQDPPDYLGASRLFKRAADLGSGEGMLNFGFLLKSGFGVQKNLDEAARYYKLSCDAGFPRGMNAYAVALENGWGKFKPNETEAAYYYKKSAEAGCPAGMRNYGFMLSDGRGVEKNTKKAAIYFKKAAKAGDEDAMINLGYMNQTGNGVEINLKEAAKYFRMAAKAGNHDGMNRYGYMLMNGDGVSKDLLNAMKYFKKAAELGNVEAAENFENCAKQLKKSSKK